MTWISFRTLSLVSFLFYGATVAAAQQTPPPAEFQFGADEVGVDEHLGARIPLDLRFHDCEGREVRLGELFDGSDPRPTILTLNYSDCPGLCSTQLSGLASGMKGMKLDAGSDYRVLTVSIDPEETHERAAATRERYLGEYGRESSSSDAWEVLTGDQAAIQALTKAVGFRYKFLPAAGQFAHTAVLVLLSPKGKITRYLYGVSYDPKTLELSLKESAAGRELSTIDRLILYCFHYDPTQGRYTATVLNIVKLSGVLIILLLGSFVLAIVRRTRSHRPESAA